MVAGYFRDSGGEDQELSVSRQLGEFLRWCTENALLPGRIFRDEARPGSSVVGRDGFQEMMAYFRSGEALESGLVVWNYQRFSRQIDDSQFFRADLRRRGYVFHSLNDEIPEGPTGRLIEAVLDWKNEMFLQDLSADVSSGLRQLVERWGAVPGTPPRGFRRDPVQISSRRDGRPRLVHRWTPDPELTPMVQRAFRMLVEGASLNEIRQATHLYRSNNSYCTFFGNPLYKGMLQFGDLIIENYCDPVVDPSLWDRAQDVLARRSQKRHLSGDNPQHPRRTGEVFLLSGLVYCARCGSPLSGLVSTGAGRTYERYICGRRKRNRDCDATPIPRLFLEDLVMRTVRDDLLQPESLAVQQAELLASQDRRKAEQAAALSTRRSRLQTVRRQIANVTDVLAETPSRALVARLTALESEETALQAELSTLELESQAEIHPLSAAGLTQLAENIRSSLEADTPALVRGMMRSLVKSIHVERENDKILAQIQYYFPPEEHPPPVSLGDGSLGAPVHRHILTYVFTAEWKRKRRIKPRLS
jgi:DNA invertase Pin-like site-specific DNA recombinase